MDQLKLNPNDFSYAPQSEDQEELNQSVDHNQGQLQLSLDQISFGPPEIETEVQIPEIENTDSAFTAFKGGIKNMFTNLGTAFDVVTGDDEEVYESALEGMESTQSQKDFAHTLSSYGDPDGVWDAVKTVGRAAWEEPKGAYHEMLAQLPNSGAIVGSMGTGAAIGTAILGPGLGTLAGGIVGLMFGNSSIEIGALANEQAQSGEYDRGKALKSGLIKGGTITAVDTATLGITKLLTGTVGRATTKAIHKVLVDKGVDVLDDAAVLAAKANPQILKEMTMAGKSAAEKASKSIMARAATPSSFIGETLGEGVGEHLGSTLAPDIEADLIDSVLESMMSMPQSGVDVIIGKSLNKIRKDGKPEGELKLGKRIAEDITAQEKYTQEVSPEDAKILASIETALNDTDNETFTEERVLAILEDDTLKHLEPQIKAMVKNFQNKQTETDIDQEHQESVKEAIKENLSGITEKLQSDIDQEIAEASQSEEFTPEEQEILANSIPLEETISVSELQEEETIPVGLSQQEKEALVDQLIEIENRGTETEQDYNDYDLAMSQVEGNIGGEEFISLMDERKKIQTETVDKTVKDKKEDITEKKPEIIKSFENKEDGVTAIVTKGLEDGKYHVGLRDNDSGEMVSVQIFDKESDAMEKAKEVYLPEQKETTTKETTIPEGWEESPSGGMITNNDPITGGIIDKQIVDGKWFIIFNDEKLDKIEGFESREDAINRFNLVKNTKMDKKVEISKTEIDLSKLTPSEVDEFNSLDEVPPLLLNDKDKATLKTLKDKMAGITQKKEKLRSQKEKVEETKKTEDDKKLKYKVGGRAYFKNYGALVPVDIVGYNDETNSWTIRFPSGVELEKGDIDLEPIVGKEKAIPPIIPGETDRRETDKDVKKEKRSGEERRKKKKKRKKISEMSEEEKDIELMVDPLTELNNKRAWEDSEKKAFQVSIDADSLKWFNDKIGHVAGDNLLVAIGKALKKTGAWSAHLSGDEYLIQTDTKEEAEAAVNQALVYLGNNPLEFLDDKGKVIAKAPGTFSYGISDTFNKADKLLVKQKESRERSGIRARRGEKPPSVEGKVAEQEQISQEKQDEAKRLFQRERDYYKNKKNPTRFDKTAVKNITGWISDLEANNLEAQEVESKIESIRDAEAARIERKKLTAGKKEKVDLKAFTYEETGEGSDGTQYTYTVNGQDEIQRLEEQETILSQILDCMGK